MQIIKISIYFTLKTYDLYQGGFMSKFTPNELDMVFGKGSHGDTLKERAKTATITWVRSQDQLGIVQTGNEKGLKMSPLQVLEIFGMPKVNEAYTYSTAVIGRFAGEPAASFIRCRERMGLSQEELAKRANIEVENVVDAENSHTRTPMVVLVKICHVLEIDPFRISYEKFE